MYPDIHDVELNLRSLLGTKPTVEQIFADTVLAHSFVNQARRYCYNRKRHEFVPVANVQKIAEDFIGRSLNELAILVALKMLQIETKIRAGVLFAKLPPLEAFEE